jgi:hypothetical protein
MPIITPHYLTSVKHYAAVNDPLATINMGKLLEGDANGVHKINIQWSLLCINTAVNMSIATTNDYQKNACFCRLPVYDIMMTS